MTTIILKNNGLKLNCPVCKEEVISKCYAVTPRKTYVMVKAQIICDCGCTGEIEFNADGISEHEIIYKNDIHARCL